MEEEKLEPLITLCPHCKTRFRVTEHQLQLAAGRVRCGACLTVFQGVEHLVWEEPSEFQSEEEAQQALDALLDELGDQSGSVAGSSRDPGALPVDVETPPDATTEADALQQKPSAAWLNSDSKLYGGHDGPTGISLEEHHWPGARAALQTGPKRTDAAEEPGDGTQEPGDGTQEPGDRTQEPEDGTQKGADAAHEPADAAQEGAVAVQARTVEPAPSTVPEPVDAGEPDLSAQDRTSGAAPIADMSTAAAALNTAPVSAAASTDPVPQFAFGEDSKRRWWVPVAMVLAVVTLCGQVLWYQFDRWSVNPDMRPMYELVCGVLDCELPVMRDLNAMVARNLVVRSHPDVVGALMVNAVIVNEAQFPQPFPVLELKFTALQGDLVAGRQFKPEEYLAGELLGAQMVASNVPVHVELAIEDPGEAAVNYFLNFR